MAEGNPDYFAQKEFESRIHQAERRLAELEKRSGEHEYRINYHQHKTTDLTQPLESKNIRGAGGSQFHFMVSDTDTAVVVQDGTEGVAVPASVDGFNVTDVLGALHAYGDSGTLDIQIRRRRDGSDVDILSTKVTIGNEQYANDGVINTANDDLEEGDLLYVDVDSVHDVPDSGLTAFSPLEFDTQNLTAPSVVDVDTNHFLSFWAGETNHGYVQVLTVNTSTWAVTTAAAPLEFDTALGIYNSCVEIDANHFLNFWSGTDADGFTQVFEVNTSTWAVTTAGATLEFETQGSGGRRFQNNCAKIDTNHFINFWVEGVAGEGKTQVFEVNTSTWAITTAGAVLTYVTNQPFASACHKIGDNHFINTWTETGNTFQAQTFEVNTSTWAVTTAAAALTVDTQVVLEFFSEHNSVMIDTNHCVAFFEVAAGSSISYFAQVLEVNTSTWAVTTAAASLAFIQYNIGTGVNTNPLFSCGKLDDTHVWALWSQRIDDNDNVNLAGQRGIVLTVNTSTWAITTTSDSIEVDSSDYNDTNGRASIMVDSTHLLTVYSGDNGSEDGLARVLSSDIGDASSYGLSVVVTAERP